jgi:hypothetical protein
MTRTAAVALSEAPSRTFAGNENFHRALCDLLDGAQSEVADYVVPETRPDEHDQFILKAYGNAARRGVRCRNLIAPQHLHIVQSTWDPDFNMREFLQKVPHIRLVDKVHGPFTVVDRRYVFLNVNNAVEPGEYTSSVVVDDPRLAENLLASFDQLWEAADGEQERLLSAWEQQTSSSKSNANQSRQSDR